MIKKAKSGRDAFKFSLRGLTTIASFSAAWAIADDRLNKDLDERLRRIQEDQPDNAQEIGAIKGRYWLLRRRRAA